MLCWNNQYKLLVCVYLTVPIFYGINNGNKMAKAAHPRARACIYAAMVVH